MKFGINLRRVLTGAELAVRIFQVTTLLPLTYMLVGAGLPYLYTHRSLFSVLFELGLAGLLRAETLGLSLLYRKSGSEMAVFFVMLAIALAVGILADNILKGSDARAKRSRIVWAALIALDLLFRFVPLPFEALPLYAAAFGFALRLGCLALILLDLRASRT